MLLFILLLSREYANKYTKKDIFKQHFAQYNSKLTLFNSRLKCYKKGSVQNLNYDTASKI